MKFRAVLFDAAETLFTTRGTVGEIYAGVAHRYGSRVPAETIHASFVRQFRGAGPLSTAHEKQWWKEVVHRVFSEVGMVDNFDRFFEEVYDQFRDAQGWVLFPETLEVLQELKRLDLKLGVISNFDGRVYSVMKSLGILAFFETVTISSETGYCKPDRRIFQSAVQAIGVPADEILFVGDSLHDDVEAGQKAGLVSVLVDRQNRHASAAHIVRIPSLRHVLPLLSEN